MKDVNILYDTLTKVELVEMVMKTYGMDLDAINKVKEELKGKLKESNS